MKAKITFAVFFVVASAHLTALSAPNDIKNDPKGSVKVASTDDARCKKDVAQYIDTLQFVRQSAGEQLSSKVMTSYVSVDQLNQVVSSAGPCAGAQLLRDKKALR